jgi:FAD/FMN-containing dehydrogenase
MLTRQLGAAIERGTAADAVIAANEAQAEALWKLRETIAEAERADGPAAKHDVSVPVSHTPAFLDEAIAAVAARFDARALAFGHLGDGNIHFNVRPPRSAGAPAWIAEHGDAVNGFVHDMVARYGGSLSAEHGIGQSRLAEFARLIEPARLHAMRAIKRALDPLGIMNPGKLVPAEPVANPPASQ